MATELITIQEYCIHHHTDVSFIEALEQNGLIHIIRTEETQSIDYEELEQLERYTRLYHDLDINVEGIEVVGYLLEKMDEMKKHIHELEERLKKYEG